MTTLFKILTVLVLLFLVLFAVSTKLRDLFTPKLLEYKAHNTPKPPPEISTPSLEGKG